MKKKQRTSKTKALSAAELDARHDAGVDLSAHMDLDTSVRPGRAVQRVNVDFPVDLLREIDQEARRLGVTRHQTGVHQDPTGRLARQEPLKAIAETRQLTSDHRLANAGEATQHDQQAFMAPIRQATA